MATALSRHHSGSYGTPHKTLPITMPSKAPAYNYPVSRVAMSPPELSDTSTSYSGSRPSGGSYSARSSNYAPSHSSGDYDSYGSNSGIDVVDELSSRMDRVFDPMKMDRSLAQQVQTSVISLPLPSLLRG